MNIHVHMTNGNVTNNSMKKPANISLQWHWQSIHITGDNCEWCVSIQAQAFRALSRPITLHDLKLRKVVIKKSKMRDWNMQHKGGWVRETLCRKLNEQKLTSRLLSSVVDSPALFCHAFRLFCHYVCNYLVFVMITKRKKALKARRANPSVW